MTRRTLAPLLLLLALQAPALAQNRNPVDPAADRRIPVIDVPAPAAGAPILRMLVIGDWGTGTKDQKAVAKAMAERAEKDPLDLVLTTGDNFYPSGVRSIDDPLWEIAFEKIYTAKSLQVPWWVTLGNHDHKGNVDAQLAYAGKSPRWKLPARHYTTTFPLGPEASVQLFAIDSDPLSKQPGSEGAIAQLAWLKKELAASKARWKVVAGHHPIHSHGKHGNDLILKGTLEPILVEGKVDLYLAGHDHTLELLRPKDGVYHVVSGGGAGSSWAYPIQWTDESFYAATGGGFALLRFGRDECWIEFVRLDGKTQFAHVVAKPEAKVGPF